MDGVTFTGGINKRGGSLQFTCEVEFPVELGPFLPPELTRRTDRPGSIISPFGHGKGCFEADSIEHAEATEAEIRERLQMAYEKLLEMRERTQRWIGPREFPLEQPVEAG